MPHEKRKKPRIIERHEVVSGHDNYRKKQRWMIIATAAAIAVAAHMAWRLSHEISRNYDQRQEISTLKANISSLESQLIKAKTKNHAAGQTVANPSVRCTGAEKDTKDRIEKTVKAEKFADLKDVLASPVNITIAATDIGGEFAPEQANETLEYLQNGSAPWNFDMDADRLELYRTSSYGGHFPTNAVVGMSADRLVVSFMVSDCGEVSEVFIAINEGMLLP